MFNATVYKTIIIAFLTLSVFFGVIGAYKLWVYESAPTSDYEEDDYYSDDEDEDVTPQNVYVGADAYNFIINSTKAAAYFVVAGFLALFAVGLEVIKQLRISNGLLVIDDKGKYIDTLKKRREVNYQPFTPEHDKNDNATS
ncbi:hypothetical protein WKH56_20285 [Priestia sp. SB1]|uniref:hypothetical protein n=1 Tax=Priestia sp. SB1 TaxID=3132359 RepID=UPI00316BFFB7